MTIAVYMIVNKIDGRCYIGQSNNVDRRFREHCGKRGKTTPITNDIVRLGVENFDIVILEEFETVQRDKMIEREMYYIRTMCTTDPSIGYNKIEGHMIGDDNPNYGNKWDEQKKVHMSELKSEQHRDGVYGDEWKSKISVKSSEFWANNPDVKKRMADKVKLKKQKYDFIQMDDDLNVIKIWSSVESIVECNPTWKWQNIYSVCNGYKKRIYGYKWKKVLKNG